MSVNFNSPYGIPMIFFAFSLICLVEMSSLKQKSQLSLITYSLNVSVVKLDF